MVWNLIDFYSLPRNYNRYLKMDNIIIDYDEELIDEEDLEEEGE